MPMNNAAADKIATNFLSKSIPYIIKPNIAIRMMAVRAKIPIVANAMKNMKFSLRSMPLT